jgi:hypothetical protein
MAQSDDAAAVRATELELRPDGVFRFSGSGKIQAWSVGKRKYVAVEPALFEFCRCFGGKKAVAVDKAISLFRKNNKKAEETDDDLLGMIPDLLDLQLLRRPGKKGGYADFHYQQLHDVPLLKPSDRVTPTFLVGAPRSGTTLASTILHAHPKVFCSVESFLLETVTELLKENTYSKSAGRFFRYAAANGESHVEMTARLSRFVDDYYSDLAKRAGKVRWVEKCVYVEDRLDLIDRLFDNRAQYLLIVRHGYDVAASLASGRAEIPKRFRDGEGLYLDQALRFWVEHTEKLLDFRDRHTDRCLLFRYEDLAREPLTEAAKIFACLGEKFSPSIIEELPDRPPLSYVSGDHYSKALGKSVVDTQAEKWKEWDPSVHTRLARIAAPTLKRLGYESEG